MQSSVVAMRRTTCKCEIWAIEHLGAVESGRGARACEQARLLVDYVTGLLVEQSGRGEGIKT